MEPQAINAYAEAVHEDLHGLVTREDTLIDSLERRTKKRESPAASLTGT